MTFIDIHSHIDMCKDIPKLISNARKANVKIILSCGIDIKTNRKVLELAEKYSEIKPCLGIYPVDALKLSEKELDSEIEFIRKNKKKIAAIGEVGLDLKENSEETLEKQKNNLKKFVLLAKELDYTIIIHSRKAEKQTIEFLESFNYNKIIMHCFNGKLNLVEKIIQNKWFLSIPTNVKNSNHFQKIIEMTPIEQLFCETDSPFLHPDKLPNNEPANVIESYKKISEIKKIPLAKVEKQIEKNFERLFS